MKNTLVAVLALVAIVACVIAWRQHAELQRLRTAVAALEPLQQRATAAEKRVAGLEKNLAATRAAVAPNAPEEKGDAGSGATLRRVLGNAAEAMSRPEVQKATALRQKAALDNSYAKLFKQLRLPPDKLEQLKRLMVERQQVGNDVFTAASQQGLNPIQNGRELAKLTAEGQTKVDADIRALLGDSDYPAYQNYQATLPQRSVVDQFQKSLSYTAAPLDDAQAEQLVQALADNQPARPANSSGTTATRSVVMLGNGAASDVVSLTSQAGLGGTAVTDAAVNASRSFLQDSQVQALQDLQQQQAQLRALTTTASGQPGQTVIQYNAISVGTTPATANTPTH